MILTGEEEPKVLKMDAMTSGEGQRQETTRHVWGQGKDQSGLSRSQGLKSLETLSKLHHGAPYLPMSGARVARATELGFERTCLCQEPRPVVPTSGYA